MSANVSNKSCDGTETDSTCFYIIYIIFLLQVNKHDSIELNNYTLINSDCLRRLSGSSKLSLCKCLWVWVMVIRNRTAISI